MKINIIFLLFIPFHVVSQITTYYRGENGTKVKIVNEYSFLPEYMWSNFYVDSISGQPYSGILTRWLPDCAFPIDSSNILNGVLNGYKKEYSSCFNIDKPQKIIYLNQELRYEIQASFKLPEHYENIVNWSSVTYIDDKNNYHWFNIKYKRRKIKVEYKFRKGSTTPYLTKYRFKNVDELNSFFKESSIINKHIYLKINEIIFNKSVPDISQ